MDVALSTAPEVPCYFRRTRRLEPLDLLPSWKAEKLSTCAACGVRPRCESLLVAYPLGLDSYRIREPEYHSSSYSTSPSPEASEKLRCRGESGKKAVNPGRGHMGFPRPIAKPPRSFSSTGDTATKPLLRPPSTNPPPLPCEASNLQRGKTCTYSVSSDTALVNRTTRERGLYPRSPKIQYS